MAISRNSGANNSMGGGGGATQTTTSTSGPRTDSSVTNQNSSTSSNENFSQNTSGSKNTSASTTTTNKTKNMSDANLAALDKLISQLAQGGTPQDQQRWGQIQAEIKANTLQQQKYSKESAQYDADTAAQAASYEALQQLVPTISAGIDSAGTSGSSMAALLSQNAADAAARTSAQLQLEAAVSYGQIANQASGNNVELLKIDNPVTQQLLAALDIAKGSVTESTQTSKSKENSTWNESTSGNRNSTSNSSSTSSTTNNIGPQTNTDVTTVTPDSTGSGPSPKVTKFPGLNTPSSYSNANSINPNKNIVQRGNSYSQF